MMGILDLLRQLARRSKKDKGLEGFPLLSSELNHLTEEDAIHLLENAASRMSRFDFLTGSLCQMTFRDRGSSDQIIYVGMLAILQMSIETGLKDKAEAQSILDSKATQDPKAEEFIAFCVGTALAFGSEEVWPNLQQTARSDGVPRLVTMTTWLVNIYEQKHSRPSVRYLKGHYANLADHIFAVGLNMAILHPEIAQDLANEPCPYKL